MKRAGCVGDVQLCVVWLERLEWSLGQPAEASRGVWHVWLAICLSMRATYSTTQYESRINPLQCCLLPLPLLPDP